MTDLDNYIRPPNWASLEQKSLPVTRAMACPILCTKKAIRQSNDWPNTTWTLHGRTYLYIRRHQQEDPISPTQIRWRVPRVAAYALSCVERHFHSNLPKAHECPEGPSRAAANWY